MNRLGDLLFWTGFRDLRTWRQRVSECRNPILLASSVGYVFARRRLLRFGAGQPAALTSAYVREIEDDKPFLDTIRATLAQWTSYRPRAVDFTMAASWGSVFFNEVALYALVRARRPVAIVETGGTPGKSAAFILRALERNGMGHLYTIDLPPPAAAADSGLLPREQFHEVRPPTLGSGWLVPEGLRARHTLLTGRSCDTLPPLLADLARVDLFLHDSDHSYENMTWELETAWSKVMPCGLLVADDVLANTAFFDFCRRVGLPYRHVFNLGVARAPLSAK